ncbi:MAG UNVERIFIED_CONTAM: MOSC domain-containing protein [Anaerolineae bacterium]
MSALFTYPIKSCGSIAHTSLAVFASGAQYDRRWMLTDTTYQFLSQREFPQLALIRTSLTEQTLRLTAPKMPP